MLGNIMSCNQYFWVKHDQTAFSHEQKRKVSKTKGHEFYSPNKFISTPENPFEIIYASFQHRVFSG
jgi:hypothetical protein